MDAQRLVGLSFWAIARDCTMPNHWFRWELSGLRSVCDVWDVREDRWELVRNKHVLKALSAIQWIHPIFVCLQLFSNRALWGIRYPWVLGVNTSLLVLMDRKYCSSSVSPSQQWVWSNLREVFLESNAGWRECDNSGRSAHPRKGYWMPNHTHSSVHGNSRRTTYPQCSSYSFLDWL